MNIINTVILQFLVSLILVQMEEHAVHRIQPTIHVVVLLVSLVLTAVQTSTSVHLAPVLTVVHALKGMGQRLYASVPKISVDLTAQCVLMVSCFK